MYRDNTQKKRLFCYHCGKPGHVSKECRTRLAAERASTNPSQPLESKPTPTAQAPIRTDKKDIVYFTCQQKGQKSPQCPQKVQRVKRIQIPRNRVIPLKHNELFVSIRGHSLPITCDSGADVTVVPEECVRDEEFTGESCTLDTFNKVKTVGRKCNVQIQVEDRIFVREAVTQPGADLSWTACLSVSFSNLDELQFITEQMRKKQPLAEEQLCYLPPTMEDGVLKSAVMVSDGTLVGEASVDAPVTPSELTPRSEEEPADNEQAGESREGESSVEAERVECLVPDVVDASDSVEAGDKVTEGSAEEEEKVTQELMLQSIIPNTSSTTLAKATIADHTLTTAKTLADAFKEGYYWQEKLAFRTRLDNLGDAREQLFLPLPYRDKCLRMANEHFGHMGRNKMVGHIRKFFYWPTITVDCMRHIRSCEICQKMDKSTPRQMIMQEQELVTIPSERVAVDLVGPFPTAKGGFKYLLTCIDLATRWPEAVPLRCTTTRIVIQQLINVFSRIGFPATLVTDNGPQFVAKKFQTWLTDKGIKHVKASPYHPQGNGVVERLHRTLNGVIAKSTEGKGNWATIVPMALYFIRCTPSSTTGISPFVACHGWEPTTPLQVLYKSWVQSDLGEIDLQDCVLTNAERVQSLREKALINKQAVSKARKQDWNRKAQSREFSKGEEVYMRKVGLNTKLSESWDGPYTVVKKNSPLSYRIHTGDRTIPSVHIQLLKKFVPRVDTPRIDRITSVFDPDTPEDDLVNRFSEARIEQGTSSEDMTKDIQQWEVDFKDTLTKEPGITHLAEFTIDTGTHQPIFQRAYNTPISLLESVDRELEWLISKGYIQPSRSPRASPMVTVRKPDGSARICVDFKAINKITQPEPFYMPRVEEVLESVGKAMYISKIDLSKGYYQVPMASVDIPNTAFTCHKGRFEFRRMLFGVKNAPAVFQELMQTIFREDTQYCSPYMDDLIICSPCWSDHVVHVRKVLTKLKKQA